MHLNSDQSALLKRVVKARERRDNAERALQKAERDGHNAALRALEAGVPQSRVADAFGVTRMTVWRWLQEQASEQDREAA
jgi:DNA invertase Pin-like site-specific DNA recombinase